MKDTLAVVGLGYVGLPLLIEAGSKGYRVVGVDVDPDRVDYINRRNSPVPEFADDRLFDLVEGHQVRATCNFGVLSSATYIVVCVPTPLGKTREPDVSMVLRALDAIHEHLRAGQVVVIESTTYPGFTREVALPLLEKSGLRVGREFFLGFSPERIDPGNPRWNLTNTPKVVAGVTEECGRRVEDFYRSIVDTVHRVSSTDAAELVKLLENTFRAVNVGLANELAMMSHRLGVSSFEVVEAAATKPFGFMPFYPGPGLGGHCIPVDPLYLSWKMKMLNYSVRFVELADTLNSSMPDYVVARFQDLLNRYGRCVRGTRILVSGVSYKRDVSDIRETPAERVLELLVQRGGEVFWYDPMVDPKIHSLGGARAVGFEEGLESAEACLIVTDHQQVDYVRLCDREIPVLDTRGVTRRLGLFREWVELI